MSDAFKEVNVLRRGDDQGNRMVVRLTTQRGKAIHAIAVQQDWPSRTGPTWAYLFENEGLTLIDAGANGSVPALTDGIRFAGFNPADIQRVIITHGHSDHDGGAKQLSEETGAQVWAHDIYAHLLPYNPWDIQRRAASPIQEEMRRIAMADRERPADSSPRESSTLIVSQSNYRARHMRYLEAKRGLRVEGRIKDGETLGGLAFMHAPGHSPDELCVTLDGVVFTGDHVLPEITPHPTTKVQYDPEIKARLPAEYRQEDGYYGLATYLNSLKMVVDLGPDVAVLPAHRLFNKGKFNFHTTSRAQEIIDHHAQRLGRILRRVGPQPAPLEEVTRGIFSKRKLIGGNLYAALSEIVAHIELLQDAGDIELTDDHRLRWTGSEYFREAIPNAN